MFSLIVASKLPCRATGGEIHPWRVDVNNALLRWTPAVVCRAMGALVSAGPPVVCGCAVALLYRRPRSAAAHLSTFMQSASVFLLKEQLSSLSCGECDQDQGHAGNPPHPLSPTHIKSTVTHTTCCGQSVKEQPDTWGFTIILKCHFYFLLLGCAVSHDAEESNFPQIPLSGRLPLLR